MLDFVFRGVGFRCVRVFVIGWARDLGLNLLRVHPLEAAKLNSIP